uniref:Uncharacterized protein n=1 Tax=Arion vulgaris TaxID=1028688 RepID=A0A0B7BBS3_9EUPU
MIMDSIMINNNGGDEENDGSYIRLSSSSNFIDEYLQETFSTDSRLSSVKESNAFLQLSPQDGATEHKYEENMPLNTQSPTHVDTRLVLEDIEEIDGDKLSDTLTSTRNSQKHKPGVILLGRGNSFSLGRSEVMVVHANRQNKRNNSKNHNSTEESDNIQNNNNHFKSRINLNQPPPPAAELLNATIQAGSDAVMAKTQKAADYKFLPVELETLWDKAERIMAAKETVVQQVLEEFGIGEAQDDSVDKVMEETIWQSVQENVYI